MRSLKKISSGIFSLLLIETSVFAGPAEDAKGLQQSIQGIASSAPAAKDGPGWDRYYDRVLELANTFAKTKTIYRLFRPS